MTNSGWFLIYLEEIISEKIELTHLYQFAWTFVCFSLDSISLIKDCFAIIGVLIELGSHRCHDKVFE